MAETLLALGPTWLASFGLNIAFLLIFAVIAKQVWPNFKPGLGVLVGFAALWTIYSATNSLLGLKQAQRLARAQTEIAQQQMPVSTAAPVTDRSPDQLRADFFNTVDAASLQPESITPQSKAALFQQFNVLFPRGDQDRLDYAKNILLAYQCQQFVFEDAMASLKSKRVVKSAQQSECEQVSGTFFGREKMIPAEVSKANADLIERLAKGKTDKDLPTEESLRLASQNQIKRIETVRKIFQ